MQWLNSSIKIYNGLQGVAVNKIFKFERDYVSSGHNRLKRVNIRKFHDENSFGFLKKTYSVDQLIFKMAD